MEHNEEKSYMLLTQLVAALQSEKRSGKPVQRSARVSTALREAADYALNTSEPKEPDWPAYDIWLDFEVRSSLDDDPAEFHEPIKVLRLANLRQVIQFLYAVKELMDEPVLMNQVTQDIRRLKEIRDGLGQSSN